MDVNKENQTTENVETAENNPTEEKTEKKPTIEEMLKNPDIQAEIDRRITKAIKTHDAKKENEADEGKAEKDTSDLLKELNSYKVKDALNTLAGDYGINNSQVPFIEKLIDMDTVLNDNNINADALKSQVDGIIKAFPFITQKGTRTANITIGSDASNKDEEENAVPNTLAGKLLEAYRKK